MFVESTTANVATLIFFNTLSRVPDTYTELPSLDATKPCGLVHTGICWTSVIVGV